MKPVKAFVAGVALALAASATAQTSGQFSQLVAYVGKLAARLLVSEQQVTTQKAQINALTVYLRDMTCKFNRANQTIADVAKATDTAPVTVSIVAGKNCAGDGPAPEIPPDLQ